MNKILAFFMLLSLVYGFFNSTLDKTISACFDGANSAVLLVMSFAGVMCLWTGIMKIAEKSGAVKLFEMVLKPVTRFLFPKLSADSDALKFITLNMTANFLGLGNGATPMGVKAMQELDKSADESATDEMCMFTVINTAAFQLIPTSVIALRNGYGGNVSVIVPIWITSVCSLIVAVSAVKLSGFVKDKL